jgi:hypothetical protein
VGFGDGVRRDEQGAVRMCSFKGKVQVTTHGRGRGLCEAGEGARACAVRVM